MTLPPFSIIKDCEIHETVRVIGWVNLYGCKINEHAFLGPHIEIGGAKIGAFTKISSHCYICPGVTIGAHCFIGHGVCFTNDLYTEPLEYQHIEDLSSRWEMKETHIGNRVRIGSNATILPVNIGDGAIIGAGAVVTRDVLPGAIIMGNPARESIHIRPRREA